MRLTRPLFLALLLSACSTVPQPRNAPPPPARSPITNTVPPTVPDAPHAQGFRPPQVMRVAGLEGVIQQDTDALVRQFGNPRLNVAEGDARKLQFAGQPCVLDIYLYPLREGGEPVATWVEARRASDGQDVDRAACAAALKR